MNAKLPAEMLGPLTELTRLGAKKARARHLCLIRRLYVRCGYKSSVTVFVNHLYPSGTIIFLNDTHECPL